MNLQRNPMIIIPKAPKGYQQYLEDWTYHKKVLKERLPSISNIAVCSTDWTSTYTSIDTVMISIHAK